MGPLFSAAWQVVHNRLEELPKNGSLDPDMQALREAVDDLCDLNASPEGPWEARDINDRDRAWGPTIWDSRISPLVGGCTWGRSRMSFDTMIEAIAVRDTLNRFKGDKNGTTCPTKSSRLYHREQSYRGHP